MSADSASAGREALVGYSKTSFDYRPGARELLRGRPELDPLIDEACDNLRRIFGADSPMVLERFDDPESPGAAPMLFLLVKTSLDNADTRALLERFDDEWWLDNVMRGNSLLQVAIEYI